MMEPSVVTEIGTVIGSTADGKMCNAAEMRAKYMHTKILRKY
jgi:hypothetical protein